MKHLLKINETQKDNPYVDLDFKDLSDKADSLRESVLNDIKNDPQYYAELVTDLYMHWQNNTRETPMMWKFHKSVDGKKLQESVSTDEVNTIKDIVQKHVNGGGSLMNLNKALEKEGYKTSFSINDMPIPPMLTVNAKGGNYVILNKKYVSDPDFVVGELAGGSL